MRDDRCAGDRYWPTPQHALSHAASPDRPPMEKRKSGKSGFDVSVLGWVAPEDLAGIDQAASKRQYRWRPGCPMCQDALTLDNDAVSLNIAYYTIAQRIEVCATRIGAYLVYYTRR
jgi:hypothetical protein